MRWLVALWILVGVAHAQSPGPLAASHARVACNDCHVNGTGALSPVLCAKCHAFVQRGLHAQFAGKACEACHGDHRGAQFDLSGWKALKAFDHAMTTWPLGGKHAALTCVRCHTGTMASGRTRFAGLSTTCGSAGCHQANPHRFAGPEFLRCDRCHTESAWKPVKAVVEFDHAATRMPLAGAHRDVACAKCHPQMQFAIAKAECASCHAVKHGSPLFDGKPCENCHTPTTFQATTFDHAERTKFPLEGKHRTACVKCHTPQLGTAVPSTKCESCHPAPTPHGKRFDKVPGGCAACHTGVKWTSVTAFAHGKTTRFPLAGKHAVIACRSCHRGTGPAQFENFNGQTGCKECHAHTTVHASKYTTKQCTQCHVNNMQEPGPERPLMIFHGPQSTFPLVKGHKAVPCADCHDQRDARGKTVFDGLSTECAAKCHEDSAHEGALGPKCSACHVAGQWEALKFEHLSYPLEGDHREVACATCHGASKKFKGAPRRCADAECHGRDDVHRGALGTTCDRCHLANGDNRFNHQISAKFKLEGKHASVPCADCHPPLADARSRAFKPRPFNCSGCHPEPRVHFGKYGTFCERCHTTRGWR